jgi:hypothetical protein
VRFEGVSRARNAREAASAVHLRLRAYAWVFVFPKLCAIPLICIAHHKTLYARAYTRVYVEKVQRVVASRSAGAYGVGFW